MTDTTQITVPAKHAGGRPSIYEDNFPDRIYKYLDDCKAKKMMPYVEQVELDLNIDDNTLSDWCKADGPRYKEKFSDAIKRLKMTQRMYLQGLGLGKAGSSTMSIFLLKANHGFIETERREVKQETSLNVYHTLTDEQLNTVIESKARKAGVAGTIGGEGATDAIESAEILPSTPEAAGSQSEQQVDPSLILG